MTHAQPSTRIQPLQYLNATRLLALELTRWKDVLCMDVYRMDVYRIRKVLFLVSSLMQINCAYLSQ
jgi:hypothetical protein